MRVTALIAAAALLGGTAAYAQQQDTSKTARGEEATANADQQDHGTAGQKMRNAMHRLGEKTRHAFHRAPAAHGRGLRRLEVQAGQAGGEPLTR